MFCYAYRAFLDALRDRDLKTLKKMTEPTLYQRLHSNFKLMDNHKCQFYMNDPAKKKISAKLLDLQVVEGVYLERSKNLGKECYDVELRSVSKQIYTKKAKTTDFDDIFQNREPVMSEDDQIKEMLEASVTLLQLEIQFESNINLSVEHKQDPSLFIGSGRDYTEDYETHILTFERYVSMPHDMRAKKLELAREAQSNSEKSKDEELVNPWLITEIDGVPNDFVV